MTLPEDTFRDELTELVRKHLKTCVVQNMADVLCDEYCRVDDMAGSAASEAHLAEMMGHEKQ